MDEILSGHISVCHYELQCIGGGEGGYMLRHGLAVEIVHPLYEFPSRSGFSVVTLQRYEMVTTGFG